MFKKVLAVFFAALFCFMSAVVAGAVDEATIEEEVCEAVEIECPIDCTKTCEEYCAEYKALVKNNPIAVCLKTIGNTVLGAIDDCIYNVLRFLRVYLCIPFINPVRPFANLRAELFGC